MDKAPLAEERFRDKQNKEDYKNSNNQLQNSRKTTKLVKKNQ